MSIARDFWLKNILKQQKQPVDSTQVDHFYGIVGCSEKMTIIFQKIQKLTESDANILILGETGTGKDLLARVIHDIGNRKNRELIPIACTALSARLFESELYGIEIGTFAEIKINKIGLLEHGHNSTIFLDEVSALSLDMQLKLLEFLNAKKIRRMGGVKEIKIDAKIISTSNANLIKLIKKYNFVADLYYKLGEITIIMPPLRDRKEDIPRLVNFFIKNINKQSKNKISGINDQAMAVLFDYNWPGNVRQLQNVIEWAAIMADDSEIIVENLTQEIRKNKPVKKIHPIKKNR